MTPKKLKAFYALATLGLFGCALLAFILAVTEQSVLSGGLPAPNRISLKDLVAQGPGTNDHVELSDFYFGKHFVYTTELVDFNEVYLPVFVQGEPEDGASLRFLVLIRNDRNSNLPLIQTRDEVGRFAGEFNRDPKSVTGVLQKPIARVRSLTVDAYPGTNGETLQVLWARDFPTQNSVNVFWILCALLVIGGIVFAVLFKRHPGTIAPAPQRR